MLFKETILAFSNPSPAIRVPMCELRNGEEVRTYAMQQKHTVPSIHLLFQALFPSRGSRTRACITSIATAQTAADRKTALRPTLYAPITATSVSMVRLFNYHIRQDTNLAVGASGPNLG